MLDAHTVARTAAPNMRYFGWAALDFSFYAKKHGRFLLRSISYLYVLKHEKLVSC